MGRQEVLRVDGLRPCNGCGSGVQVCWKHARTPGCLCAGCKGKGIFSPEPWVPASSGAVSQSCGRSAGSLRHHSCHSWPSDISKAICLSVCVCVSVHTGGFIKKLQSSNVALFKYTKRLLALRLVSNLRWLQIHDEQAKNTFWFLSLDFSVVVWKILYNNPDSVQLNWSSNNTLSLALHDIYFTTYLLEGEAICIHKIFICIYDLSSLHGKFTPFLQIMLFTSLKCLCIHNASSTRAHTKKNSSESTDLKF